jgi:ribosomal protein S18 acetylase RimI-like enzyme
MSDPAAASRMFEEYRPRDGAAGARPIEGVLIRPADAQDIEVLAEIAHERGGGERTTYINNFTREIADLATRPDRMLLSSVIGDRVVAFARARRFTPVADAPPNAAPTGWYLLGVTVDRAFRRRGIGRELTRARLIEIAKRSSEAFYFANALNRSSIDLHAGFGFVELTRDFWFPQTSFVGGVGILFRVQLT